MDNNARLINKCQQLFAQGQSTEEVLIFLRSKECSKVESIVIISKIFGIDLQAGKEMVHNSNTWSDLREQHEKLHESLDESLRKINSSSDSED